MFACVPSDIIGAPTLTVKFIHRYVNAVALRRGLSKDTLLSCEWAALQNSHADFADWPLLQSMAAETERTATASQASLAAGSPAHDEGVEETKEGKAPGVPGKHATRAADGGGACDEWVVATTNAPTGGVGVKDAPLHTADVVWRLSSGQVARLFPRRQTNPRAESISERLAADAEESGWRQIDGVGGEGGWVELSPIDAPAPPIEKFWTDRLLLDGFPPQATNGTVDDSNGHGCEAGVIPRVPNVDFWLPLRRGESGTATGGVSTEATPSSDSATDILLQGDSDALLLSAGDVAATEAGTGGSADVEHGNRGSPLLVTGKWKVGLVTDTLTVTTRTSGCIRIVAPSPADDDSNASRAALDGTGNGGNDQSEEPLPVLCDGLVCGFRAVDGRLIITRAFPRASEAGKSTGWGAAMHMEPVGWRAVASLGRVDEGVEIVFSVIDTGEDVVFCCREVGGSRRAATVRAECRDTWGRGRVSLGARVAPQDSASGWVRVVSQAHGATVRAGRSIDADGVVGRIPCGTVVPYDCSIVYHSPGAPDRGAIDPVVRYRCIATSTTPMGWISERGRYAEHPYRICERITAKPQQPPHLLSHLSVARVSTCVGGTVGTLPLPRTVSDPQRSEKTAASSEDSWRRRLTAISVLSTRFRMLQQLNRRVSKALRYINLAQGDLPWSMGALLSRCRHLVFSSLKQELWEAELKRTLRPMPSPQSGMDGGPPSLELRLSRGRAASERLADKGERHTLFGQAFVALRDAPAEAFRLRAGEVLYSTVFLGEHAHDAGGE